MNVGDHDEEELDKTELMHRSRSDRTDKVADRKRPELTASSTLIGDDVCNRDGEELGDIEEIMLDMRTGRIGYVVLAFGGFLGMGEKFFAVPWDAIRLDEKSKRLILDVDRERLVNAPGFDKEHWPDMADPSWQRAINSHYAPERTRIEEGL
ncbi:MAG: PRC-barrel domain-containing protein [Gammaproteobacteria bacterium]|nr:PRC-barrel domain-containing protein [Gammaproteobacteria bacterium]